MASIIKNIKSTLKQYELLTVTQETTAIEAARKMNEHRIGFLVVLDSDDKIVGVLSERDMLTKVVVASSPEKQLVRDIMTTKVITCNPQTTVTETEQLMAKHKIRHLPIFQDGTAVGVISSRDIIAYQLQIEEKMKLAAEDLAFLSARLKTCSIEDIVKLAIDEVPRSFAANRAVLYIKQPDSSDMIIHHRGCLLSEAELHHLHTMEKLSSDGKAINCQACEKCCKSAAGNRRLVIPLSIYEKNNTGNELNRLGMLCMCCLDSEPEESKELPLYKVSLLQEILNINLTNANLYEKYQKVRKDSEIDPLTGAYTRRILEQQLKAEIVRTNRYHRNFCVALFDVDKLKDINDKFGHSTGDHALVHIVAIIQENIRKSDTLSRYGGDEFVLLMPETNLDKAASLLERLLAKIETTPFGKGISLTSSCGLAEATRDTDETPESILQKADEALYRAKNHGCNCIVTTQPPVDVNSK